MKVSGKNIVLTGGTTGIGREMVKQLHEDNQLLVMASNQSRLDALAAEYPYIKTTALISARLRRLMRPQTQRKAHSAKSMC